MKETDTTEHDSKQRLLSAAGPVFASRGYEQATVREICAAASVNIASVGYYFGDKLGLYREVIRDIRESKTQQFPIPDKLTFKDPKERLFQFVRTLLGRMLNEGESGWQVALLMREMQRPTVALDDIVGEHFQPVFDDLHQTLSEIGGELRPQQLDHHVLSVIGQCFHYRVGQNTIPRIVSKQTLGTLSDLDSLAVHITSVTLCALDSALFGQMNQELRSLAKASDTVVSKSS